jgi:hypothetical protein
VEALGSRSVAVHAFVKIKYFGIRFFFILNRSRVETRRFQAVGQLRLTCVAPPLDVGARYEAEHAGRLTVHLVVAAHALTEHPRLQDSFETRSSRFRVQGLDPRAAALSNRAQTTKMPTRMSRAQGHALNAAAVLPTLWMVKGGCRCRKPCTGGRVLDVTNFSSARRSSA